MKIRANIPLKRIMFQNDEDFVFRKKYAYIERKITMTNGDERVSKKTFTLWLDVDVTGDIHAKPGTADITVN